MTDILELIEAAAGHRDDWVKARVASGAAGSRVLDVGAGTRLYGKYFSHCAYEARDFAGCRNYQDGTEGAYTPLTYVSDKRLERSEVQRKRKAQRHLTRNGADNFAVYALRVAKHHADRETKKSKRR